MQLAVRNIDLTYGDKSVLNNVNLALGPGERALLLGASGSGKTSLLNVICGLQSPNNGSVTLGEFPIDDAQRQHHIGIVFQTLRLVSALNVRANLLLAQKLQRGIQDSTKVDEVLEQLGIAEQALARPFELSQGEAQRAAIARALVVKPSLLIADEPTSSLDEENTDSVARLLLDAATQGNATLLVATHDKRLATHFGKIMALKEGRLEQ